MRKSGFLRAVSIFLAIALATVVFAQGPTVPAASARKEVTVKHDTLVGYVGTYELAPQANISITLDGEQLQAQLGGQARFPVFAESNTKFFYKVVDAQLEFKPDAAGKVSTVVLHQNGNDIEAHRVAERKEVKLAADVLALYPGTYAGTPLSFTVTLENGQLQVQATGQQKLELFAEAQDKFFLKVVNAQIEFVRETGKVKALILHQGPATLRAERQ